MTLVDRRVGRKERERDRKRGERQIEESEREREKADDIKGTKMRFIDGVRLDRTGSL